MDKEKNCPVCRWRRRKEARPSEILDAALGLFAKRGYAATTLDQIAKAAGISKGTLYLYYDNKEELFRSMVQDLVIPHVEAFEQQANEFEGSAAELLRRMAHGWWQVVANSALAGMPKLMIAEAANFPETAKFYVDAVIVRGRKLVSAILQRGIDQGEFRQFDTELAARVMFSSLVFSAIWKESLAPYDAPYSVEDYIDLHLDMAINGLTI